MNTFWKMGFEENKEDEVMRISEWSEYVDVGMARDFAPKLREAMKKGREEGQ